MRALTVYQESLQVLRRDREQTSAVAAKETYTRTLLELGRLGGCLNTHLGLPPLRAPDRATMRAPTRAQLAPSP